MPLTPGTSAFNAALDAHITGNYGAEYDKGSDSSDDEFYDLAERTQEKRLQEAVCDLLLGRIEWEDMVEAASLDEQDAHLLRLQLIQPTTEEGREAYVAFRNASEQVARVFGRIPFDDHKTTELARELADEYWERKDRGY